MSSPCTSIGYSLLKHPRQNPPEPSSTVLNKPSMLKYSKESAPIILHISLTVLDAPISCLLLGVSIPKWHGYMTGGELILICTSLAPAILSISTIFLLVVPRTIESSIITTRLPFRILLSALSFIRTPSSLIC